MFQEDWLIRQIEGYAQSLSKLIFNKDTTQYTKEERVTAEEPDLLCEQLDKMIGEGRINEAENLLFERINPLNKRYLEIAIHFYSKLNDLSDERLEESGFTRAEIDEGLKSVAEKYGVSF